MASPRTDRVRSQLELALLSDCGCKRTLEQVRLDAREAGLCGAEIVAALGNRSFDIRTAAIIDVACALKSGEEARLERARRVAAELGWTHEDIAGFEALSREIVARAWPRAD